MGNEHFFNRIAKDFGLRPRATGLVGLRNLVRRIAADRIAYSENILDVGVGNGLMFPHLRQTVPYTGLDSAERMLALCAERATAHGVPFTPVCADAAHLPFPDASFDTVLCIDVLHHVPRARQERVLSECLRVARPGGQIILEVKNGLNGILAASYVVFGLLHRIPMNPVNPFKVRAYFRRRGCRVSHCFAAPFFFWLSPFIVFDIRVPQARA